MTQFTTAPYRKMLRFVSCWTVLSKPFRVVAFQLPASFSVSCSFLILHPQTLATPSLLHSFHHARLAIAVSEYDYPVIALGPWVSPDCIQSFLAAFARGRHSSSHLSPAINQQDRTPPPVSDERWDLSDGDQWRSQTIIPSSRFLGQQVHR